MVNGKIYIGQTIQEPFKRESAHFWSLRNNNHRNKHLQSSFNKYGESNFKFTILNYATTKEVLDQLEDDYINHYSCLNPNKGYNLQTGGANGKPCLKTRRKMSEVRKGITFTKAHRNKLSEIHKGRKLSPEHCKNIGKAHKGKKRSKNARKNLSVGKRGRGLFGFTGTFLDKRKNFEKRAWQSTISYKGHNKSLGIYEDPLTAQIIHDLVFDEIFHGR